MAASELDAADTVAIANLFREDGEDDDPADVATIGPHNKPSGTTCNIKEHNAREDLVNDRNVKHISLQYRMDAKDGDALSMHASFVSKVLDKKNYRDIHAMAEQIYEQDPYTLFLTASYITMAISSQAEKKIAAQSERKEKEEKAQESTQTTRNLLNIFISLVPHETDLKVPVYYFIVAALAHLVQSRRFEELEFISLHFCKHLMAYLLKLYVRFRADRSMLDDGLACQSLKNCYDLIASLIMWHQHSPKVVDHIREENTKLLQMFPVMNCAKTWARIETGKVERPDVFETQRITRKSNLDITSDNNSSHFHECFIKAPRVKVGKHLKGSGTQAWSSLCDAIDFGVKCGNIPGKSLFYIQRLDNKIYFYARGDESGVSGIDTWAFQSSASTSDASHDTKRSSLKDVESKEARMALIRQRMQNGTKSPSMVAQMAQIQNMGFTDVQAYAALKKESGNVERALDYLLKLSDAEKEELGLDLHSNLASSGNQKDDIVDDSAPDAPLNNQPPDAPGNDESKIDAISGVNNDAEEKDGSTVDTLEFWCFERHWVLLWKSLHLLFRGYKHTRSWISTLLQPFHILVDAPNKFPHQNDYEKEEVPGVYTNCSGADHVAKSIFDGFLEGEDSKFSPPWFEGLYHSGLAENAPGAAVTVKAIEQQYGSSVAGSTFDVLRGIDFEFKGVAYPIQCGINSKKRDCNVVIEGLIKSSTIVEPLTLVKCRESGILVGWHVNNGKYRAFYGRRNTRKKSTRVRNFVSARHSSNAISYFSNFNNPIDGSKAKLVLNQRTCQKRTFLFGLGSPFLRNNSTASLKSSVKNFQIATALYIPPNYQEFCNNSNLVRQQVHDKDFPDILCGIVCFENCGIALTTKFHIVAWSICRNEKNGIDEETGGEKQTVIPKKRELTVDLKSMVEAGIITEDQAYSMMGVDETTSSSMPNVAAENNNKEEENNLESVGDSFLSFIVSPEPLQFDTSVFVKFAQHDQRMDLVINNAVVSQKLIETEHDGLYLVKEELRENKRTRTSNENQNYGATPFPISATTVAAITRENLLFNHVSCKDECLDVFYGAVFETSLSVNSTIEAYWPLSSDFAGVDCSHNNHHLAISSLDLDDLRNGPRDTLEKHTIANLFNYNLKIHQEQNSISKFAYHTLVQNMYRLSGFTSISKSGIAFLHNKGSGAIWLSHRHSVTGGFDFSSEMDIHSESMKDQENKDAFDYTLIIRKSSFWRINPLENIDVSNVSSNLQSSLLDSYDEFWQDKIVDSDAEEEIFDTSAICKKHDNNKANPVECRTSIGNQDSVLRKEWGCLRQIHEDVTSNEVDSLKIGALESQKGENTSLLEKARKLLASGTDQAAVLKKLRQEGVTVSDAMQLLQKALSQNFSEPSAEESSIAKKDIKAKEQFATPTSLSLRVISRKGTKNRCDIFLVLKQGQEMKIILSIYDIIATGAKRPTLIYREKSVEASSRSHLCIFFDKRQIARVDFDIKKELFFGMQDDFDDGVWIGLLNEALSCGEDSSGDNAELHSIPSHVLLTQLNFRGVSSRTVYKAKAGKVVDPEVTQHANSSGLQSFPSDAEPLSISWGGTICNDTVIQPLNENISLTFNTEKFRSILSKSAWIGVYDASKIFDEKSNRFIAHCEIKPYMCQGDEYLVTLENFKVDRPMWVEFRLFKDVSSDGFVAASGIYRFDKKAPSAISDMLRREQSELFKKRENKYMRLRLTQECFYYKSTLSENALNELRIKTKKQLSNGNISGKESSTLTKSNSCGVTESFENATEVNTSSYLSDLIDTCINGRDLSHTKHLLNFISGEWDTTSCGCFGFETEKNAQSEEVVVPVFLARCTFSKTRVSSTDKVPSDVLGTIIPRRNQVGRHWHFQGTWIPHGKKVPNVCYWNYDGRGEKARGKWFKGGEISGSWTLTKQIFKDHFRSSAFYSGLINMSDDLVNVCYQNSVMQCLYNSEFFREKIFSFGNFGDVPDILADEAAAELSNEEKSAIRVFSKLKKLYSQLTYSQKSSHASHALQKEITQVFDKGRQQDAHAFLVYLLDNLNTAVEKLQAIKAKSPIATSSDETKQKCQRNQTDSNFVRGAFEGTTGVILKRRDTGLTWVTNQDVFTNLSVSLPQRYAPITKISVLTMEDVEKQSETNVEDKGYEILGGEITVEKDSLSVKKKLFLAVYRGEKHGLPITKLKILRFGIDDGIVLPEGYKILMNNLDPTASSTVDNGSSKKTYLAYQQGTNSVPIVEMALCIGGKKVKPPSKDFVKLPESLNGDNGHKGTYCYLAYKKDSTAVRELRLGNGVCRSLEKDFTKLKVNMASVGSYDAAAFEMSEKRKSTAKVNFNGENTRETFDGGPDRVTSGTWGVYIAGKVEMSKINMDVDIKKLKANLEYLGIDAILDLSSFTPSELGANYGDHYFHVKGGVHNKNSWDSNIEDLLKFISSEKLIKRNILIVADNRDTAAAVMIMFFMRTKHWKLLKAWKFMLSRLHKSSYTVLGEYVWERLLQYELNVPNICENSMTWDTIKTTEGRGTRKQDRQKFNFRATLISQPNGNVVEKSSSQREMSETTKLGVSLTSVKGEFKSGDYSIGRKHEDAVVILNSNTSTTTVIDEAALQQLFLYVSYGGNGSVITGIELVSSSQEAKDKNLEICCKLDSSKYLAVRRGQGCPVVNVQLFKAPYDIPRFQGFEAIDLILHSVDKMNPMKGIWKPSKEDKLDENFNFFAVGEKNAVEPCTKLLVHGTTQTGATIRGLLSSSVIGQDEGLNPEERVNRIGKWFIDGLIIDDARIEPFKLSYDEGLGFSYMDQGEFCACKKISKTPLFGLPLTGIMIVRNPEKETQDGWTVLRKTVSGTSVANFGSEEDPAYLCVRYGGNFPSISKVYVVWNGIENIPPEATMVEGNLNLTQTGMGPEVVLCYDTISDAGSTGSQSVITSISISKDTEKTSGYVKKITTDSLAMNASFNQNPQLPNFYLCVKTGNVTPKKQVKHELNGTYVYGGEFKNSTGSTEASSSSATPANAKANGGKRFSLFVTMEVKCIPVDAEYQLWRPKNYRGKLQSWMFKETGKAGVDQWTMLSKYETKRDKGAAVFSIDLDLKRCEGILGKNGKKILLIRDSYLKLGFQRDYMSDWANGVEVFSGRCRGNRIDDMLAQDVSVLGGKNAWRDENGVAREVTRTAVVVNAPDNLIVHVNRSKWDVQKGQLVKDNRSIQFDPMLELPGKKNSWPEEIKNMTRFSAEKSRCYGLYGIVVHSGTTANSGHYYSYARQSNAVGLHLQESPTSPWFCFNDTKVTLTNWSTMTSDIKRKKNHSAYLLFYRKLMDESTSHAEQKGSFVESDSYRQFIKSSKNDSQEEIIEFLSSTKSEFYDDWIHNDLIYKLHLR